MTENKRNLGAKGIRIVAVLLIAVLAYLTVTMIAPFPERRQVKKKARSLSPLEV